jgi:hypothetical protein
LRTHEKLGQKQVPWAEFNRFWKDVFEAVDGERLLIWQALDPAEERLHRLAKSAQ